MEIHIQLAGVEMGPYAVKKVREYLSDNLLTPGDPARLDGTPTWETVADVLAKLDAPASAPIAAPEKAEPVAILPQAPVSTPTPPSLPVEVRKSPTVTTTSLARTNPKSRDTIRVPLPQIAEALARQTAQGARKAIPSPAAAAPAATGQTRSSEKARTSLLTAVNQLAKKAEPAAKATPADAPTEASNPSRPQTVPVTFPQSADSFRTIPMSMGKMLAKKPDPEDKPMPAEPAAPSLRKPDSVSAKALDPKRTSLLSPVRVLARKSQPIPPPAVTTEAPQAPDASGVSFSSSKSPQTVRTAPMSVVRALPKKNEPEAKEAPEPLETGLTPVEPPPPPATVRFVPGEAVPETEKASAAPPVSPETVLSKKSLRRTTGSLPSLVKALEKKPEEAASSPAESIPSTEAESSPETSDEVVTEEKSSLRSPAPFPSLIRSWGQKIGLWKSAEPAPQEEPTEISMPENETAEPVSKAPELRAEKTESVARELKPLTRLPGAEAKPLEPVSKIPQPLTRLPEPKKPAEPETKPQESVSKIRQPLTRLPAPEKPAEPEAKPQEPVSKIPQPLTRLPAPEKPTEPEAKPAVEAPAEESLESPGPDVSGQPTKLSRGIVIGLVILVVVLGLSAGVLSYVRSSYATAGMLLQALKYGDQAELEKVVDFPAVRQSLKDEVAAQLAKSGSTQTASNPDSTAVLAMIKNSIDYYVTPEAISALASKSGKLPAPGPDPTLQASSASAILSGLNNLPVKSQSLVSYNLYVIDLGAAKLDLQSGGPGWKLNRIELKADFQMPEETGATGTPADLASSLAMPVMETYFDEGKSKFQAQDWDGAIDMFTKVLALDPKQVVAYSNRGMAKSQKAAAEAMKSEAEAVKGEGEAAKNDMEAAKGDWDGAIADFTQAIALDPRLAETYYNRGEAKAAKGDADGAVADYTQAANLDPKMGMAFYKRGGIRTLKGDYEGAIADYTQDIAVDPNYANAYNNRGYVRRAQNDLDGAIADFTQALAINPKIAGAYYNRALAKESKADLDGAILDFDQALDLDPKLARAYYNRGIAKNTKNDLDGALADYNQALALDPKLAPALTDRALVKQAKGDLQGALDDFNQALASDPKIADAYYSRGLIKEQLNDLDGAINDSSRAIDLDPKRVQSYYNRGFAKLVKGNLEGARADLEKFCEMAPRDPYADHARLYLWLIAMAQNPHGTANQDLSDALQNNWSLGQDDLVTKIASFLLDRTNEADLVAAAASSNPKKDQGQHCEVWYFAGMKRLLAGDKVTAIDYFHKCMATGQRDYCEYILAQAELQALAPNP